MQSSYPPRFEREVGSSEADWLARLPQAVGTQALALVGRSVTVTVGAGHLALSWRVVEPLAIGLVRLPRLRVSFDFAGVDDTVRHAFMARFDLYMQRGGG